MTFASTWSSELAGGWGESRGWPDVDTWIIDTMIRGGAGWRAAIARLADRHVGAWLPADEAFRVARRTARAKLRAWIIHERLRRRRQTPASIGLVGRGPSNAATEHEAGALGAADAEKPPRFGWARSHWWSPGLRVRYRGTGGVVVKSEWGTVDIALDGVDVVRTRLAWNPDLRAVSGSAPRTEKGRCAM